MRHTALLLIMILGLQILGMPQSNLSLGGSLNSIHGDIPSTLALGGDIGFEWKPSQSVGIFGQGHLGALTGSRTENGGEYTFNTSLLSALAGINIYPIGLLNGNQFTTIQPFLRGGVGFYSFDVSDITQANNGVGMPYNGTGLLLGVGAGLDANFSQTWGIRLAATYMVPGSDEMDGWNPAVSSNTAEDFYTNIGLSIIYRLGQGSKTKASPQPKVNVTEEPSLEVEVSPGTVAPASNVAEVEEETSTEESTVGRLEEAEQGHNTTQTTSTPMTTTNAIPAMEAEMASVNTTQGTTPQQNTGSSNITSSTPTTSGEPTNTEEVSVFRTPVLNINGSLGNKQFYVIGASFNNLSRAQEYQFEMAAKGYATLIVTDVERTRYRISFGSFDNVTDARELANKLQQIHDPNTWIIQNGR